MPEDFVGRAPSGFEGEVLIPKEEDPNKTMMLRDHRGGKKCPRCGTISDGPDWIVPKVWYVCLPWYKKALTNLTGAIAEFGTATIVARELTEIIKEWDGASVAWSCQREGESCIASILKCLCSVDVTQEEIAA
jgi:hypothetical protein